MRSCIKATYLFKVTSSEIHEDPPKSGGSRRILYSASTNLIPEANLEAISGGLYTKEDKSKNINHKSKLSDPSSTTTNHGALPEASSAANSRAALHKS